MMEIEKELKECFKSAKKDKEKNRKHKGLLVVKPSEENAKNYISKAKDCMKFAEMYSHVGADYRIPEEWFYTLYYCAMAILAKFGVESRSQKYTALFLKYIKSKEMIDYDEEFIDRIMVYKEIGMETSVDKREEARYSPKVKIEEVARQFAEMMDVCKRAISQCEEIVFSGLLSELPKGLL